MTNKSSSKFSNEERVMLGDCWNAIHLAQKHLQAALNTSISIKENETLRSIYFNLQKQKTRLNKIVEK